MKTRTFVQSLKLLCLSVIRVLLRVFVKDIIYLQTNITGADECLKPYILVTDTPMANQLPACKYSLYNILTS